MFKITEFGGVAPRFPDRKLPLPYALRAHNCKMDRSQLRSFGGSVVVDSAMQTNTKTVFEYTPFGSSFLLEFPFKASVVQNALPNDTYKRVYWTDDSGENAPRFAGYSTLIAGGRPYPSASFLLGLPAPTTKPIITLGANIDPDFPEDPSQTALTPYYRYFTYTIVDRYGHESGPYAEADGSALEQIKVYEGQSISVTNLPTSIGGNYNLQGGLIRLYMSDLLGNWRLMFSAALGTREFLDFDHMTVDSRAIMLPETQICEPPLADLKNLVVHPSGYMLGSSGSTLCATPLYFFHNWPSSYQRPCQFDILGIVPHAQGAFLITKGGLYSAIGSDAANLTIVEINTALGCVAEDSIVDMGGFAMYASYNGVVVATLGEAKVVTYDVMLANDWAGYSPETMEATRHQDRYIIWNETHGFCLKPDAESDKLTTFDLASDFNACFVDKEDGHLRYRVGNKLYKFDADPNNPHPYLWESTTQIAQAPISFSCLKIDAESVSDITYNIIVGGSSIFSDGAQAATVSPEPVYYARLPPYRPQLDVKVVLAGSDPINSIVLANSFREMKGE